MFVRRATVNDATFIALLGRVTFSETFSHYFRYSDDLRNYLERTFGVEKIRKSLLKENNLYWLAIKDELPIGYMKIKRVSPCDSASIEECSQLQKIYLLNDFQGQGIGRAFMKEMIAEVNQPVIWLSVLKENQKAANFYREFDFRTIGEQPFSIGKEDFDFAVMQRILR